MKRSLNALQFKDKPYFDKLCKINQNLRNSQRVAPILDQKFLRSLDMEKLLSVE